MHLRENRYWLLSVAAGFIEAAVWAAFSGRLEHSAGAQFALAILGPAIFGAVFAFCVWNTIGATLLRAFGIVVALVAAHNFGFYLAVEFVRSFVGSIYFFGPFIYGVVIALTSCVIVAFIKPEAPSEPFFFGSLVVPGIVALVIWPLEWLHRSGFLTPSAALGITFGFVYATVATVYGRHVLRKPMDNLR